MQFLRFILFAAYVVSGAIPEERDLVSLRFPHGVLYSSSCVDKHSFCGRFAASSKCKTNGQIRKRCQKSCNLCNCLNSAVIEMKARATDSLTKCNEYAIKGQCQNNEHVMKRCQASCGVCDGGDTTANPVTTPKLPTVTKPPKTDYPCGIKPNPITSRIVEGEEAGPYSLPWQVALVKPGYSNPFCGGTLISDRHVLTAAHCTGVNDGVWDVIVGEHDHTSSSDGTRHTVCRVKNHNIHFKFPRAPINDFAIVTLRKPVAIGARANYACLPTSEMGGSFLDDKTMTVSGWGKLGAGQSQPDKLYTVDLHGVSNAECYFSKFLTEQMLCAGKTGENKVGACAADSGGPLTYDNGGRATLVGVVSWGSKHCDKDSVFARVTAVLPWIKEQMEKPCQ